ncbi:hypothetical protein LNO75_01010 [Mycoplasma sp. T363T]|uniref:hypothetical protein n=1 Tax=Mycoplasma bradburyae TaxID=2963128 RepID=UPI002341A8C7|nr:hypothetical protein [Mycoplasma bradburyae]MDC4163157.1 hypothetical protein [Mycoplasma bradburyae]
MKKFCITRIEIYDVIKNEAFFANFKKGINVVTSTDNHVGKSCLLKSIYYSFGCNIEYDSAWDKKSKLVSVEFMLDNDVYKISRLNDRYLLQNSNRDILVSTKKVGEQLTPFLAELFEMEIHLTSKNKKLELAPPVYFFLPYYIDQDIGWSNEPFNSFLNLEQYNKKERLKCLYYHLGLYNKETILLTNEIEDLKNKKLKSEQSKTKYIELKNIIEEEIKFLKIQDNDELQEGLDKLKDDITEKLVELDKVKDEIEKAKLTLANLEYNLKILENDYENLDSIRFITCPNCGFNKCKSVIWKNENITEYLIFEKFSELNTEFSINEINKMISEKQKFIDEKTQIYQALYNELALKKQESENCDAFTKFIKVKGSENIKIDFDNKIANNIVEINETTSLIKSKVKKLNEIKDPQKLNNLYKEEVINFLHELNAWDERSSSKITLLKPFKGQGNLAVKSIVASYLSLFKVMKIYNNEVTKFTFIIDSPRSKEASDSSSIEILSKITNISNLEQVIIATINYDSYSVNVKSDVNKIVLNDQRHLLNSDVYSELKNEEFIEFMKNSKNWQ